MKRLIVVIVSIFTLTAMVAYCATFYHAHIITGYCPMGGPHVVTCTPPGATLDGHVTGSNIKSYNPHFPLPEPWDEDICQGYVAGGSQVCSAHEGN